MAEIIIKLKGYECERCNHKWIPRSKETPVICPECKSPYWNKPKKHKSKKIKLNKKGEKDKS